MEIFVAWYVRAGDFNWNTHWINYGPWCTYLRSKDILCVSLVGHHMIPSWFLWVDSELHLMCSLSKAIIITSSAAILTGSHGFGSVEQLPSWRASIQLVTETTFAHSVFSLGNGVLFLDSQSRSNISFSPFTATLRRSNISMDAARWEWSFLGDEHIYFEWFLVLIH